MSRRLSRLAPVDWLMMDEQKLLEVTGGELFRDDLRFAQTRAQLAFYPDDLRLHLMTVEWMKIADEQAFPARAGARGDEAGAALVQARLAESAIRLCFQLERRYPPYAKWLGTAFQRLAASAPLQRPLTALLAARDWQERDGLWSELLVALIGLHERAGLLEPGKYQPAPVYLGRPGTGLPQFDRGGPPAIPQLIADLRARITDPQIAALSPRLGNINQLAASRDLEAALPQLAHGLRAALPRAAPPDPGMRAGGATRERAAPLIRCGGLSWDPPGRRGGRGGRRRRRRRPASRGRRRPGGWGRPG